MTTLRDYFLHESAQYLDELERELEHGSKARADEVYRDARALRGMAQIAREAAALRAAQALEAGARAVVDQRLRLDPRVCGLMADTVREIRTLAGQGSDSDAAAQAIEARWRELGVEASARQQRARPDSARSDFLRFAAAEVAGIAHELENSVAALTAEPMDRASLKAVLRRQRALLGSARLDEVPVIAEALRAVEDLSGVIAKLNVAVKHEWLDVFRSAREVLRAAVEPLGAGEQPEATHALSRLRVLREELLDRHGAAESVSVAPGEGLEQAERYETPPEPPSFEQPTFQYADETEQETETETAAAADVGVDIEAALPADTGFDTAAPVAAAEHTDAEPPATPGASAPGAAQPSETAPAGPIDVDALQYRGDRALDRALELRPLLERLVGDRPGGRELLDEFFDLIQLARE